MFPFHPSLLCSWPTGSRGPDESLFSPYMAKPCAVQPGQLYGAVVWGARAFVDTGHRVPPKTQARWHVGTVHRLPPLDPAWGLGRERDQLCGPAYPYCVCGDLVPGVSLLSFLVVLRCEYLSRSECLLWVLGKITSRKCEDEKVSTFLLSCLLRPPLSFLDTLTRTHVPPGDIAAPCLTQCWAVHSSHSGRPCLDRDCLAAVPVLSWTHLVSLC